MILHFLTDDLFSEYVIKQFSDAEMQSEIVLISEQETPQYIKDLKGLKRINPNNTRELKTIYDSLSRYSAIVLHGLFEPWCEDLLKQVPDNVKVAWMFWGGEIYGREKFQESFLAPHSRRVFQIRKLLKSLSGKRSQPYELPINLFERVDYCLTDMKEEYELVKSYLGIPKLSFHWYNYYSVEETIGDLKRCKCEGNNVILGNSATIDCNYFDVMPKLRRIIPSSSKVIIPLGYGAPWIRDLVLKYGQKLYGNQFYPLVGFMPREDYNKVLLSCSTMIQPHYRNQAQGNIITGLWLGMRVYLSEKSVTYSYFKRIGAVVFSIEKDLSKDIATPFTPLPVKDVEHNREVLGTWYSKDAMRVKNLELVELLGR